MVVLTAEEFEDAAPVFTPLKRASKAAVIGYCILKITQNVITWTAWKSSAALFTLPSIHPRLRDDDGNDASTYCSCMKDDFNSRFVDLVPTFLT